MGEGEVKLFTWVSYLTSVDEEWRPQDHDASKFVKALKGEQLNGYANVPVPIGGAKHRLDNDNLDAAPKWAGAMMTNSLTVVSTTGWHLVPVPTSRTTADSPVRGAQHEIAYILARQLPRIFAGVADLLRFKEVRQSARHGGTRDVRELVDNLAVLDGVPRRAIVIDDVVTSQAHMKAVVRVLREAGAHVGACLAVARARDVQAPRAFKYAHETIDVDVD